MMFIYLKKIKIKQSEFEEQTNSNLMMPEEAMAKMNKENVDICAH